MTALRVARLKYLVRKMLRGYELDAKERRELDRLMREWEEER